MNLVSKQRVGSLRETLKSNFAAPQLRAESSELSESKSPETFNDRCKENKKNRDQKILWSDLNCKNPPQHCQKSHIIRDKVMIPMPKQLRVPKIEFFLISSAKSSRGKWILEVDLDTFSINFPVGLKCFQHPDFQLLILKNTRKCFRTT